MSFTDTHTHLYLEQFKDDLDNFLEEEISDALNDALFPFVRQFANHDREWFDSQNWNNIHGWLSNNLASDEFMICMKKYPQWHEGDDVVEFPIIG